MLLEPVVEIRFRRVVTLCDESLCRAVGQQALDFWPEWIQLALAWPFGPPEYDALIFLEAQRFLGSLRNQIAFDLCRH